MNAGRPSSSDEGLLTMGHVVLIAQLQYQCLHIHVYNADMYSCTALCYKKKDKG